MQSAQETDLFVSRLVAEVRQLTVLGHPFIGCHVKKLAIGGTAAMLSWYNRRALREAVIALWKTAQGWLGLRKMQIQLSVRARISDWAVWFRGAILRNFGRSCGNECVVKAVMHNLEIEEASELKGHSHPEAAGVRNRSSNAIMGLVQSLGRTSYVVSWSGRDGEARGFHDLYMARDGLKVGHDVVGPNDVIVMIDSDYYVDIANWSRHGRPLFLYTFVPDSVSGTTENGSFTIMNNEVNYRVTGGGQYRHRLWDYNHDFVVVDHWWGSTCLAVEQRQVGRHRRIVALVPQFRVLGPLGWLLPGKRLGRMQFAQATPQGVVNTLISLEDGVEKISLGREGIVASVSLATDLYEALKIRFRASTKPAISDVERYLRQYSKDSCAIEAALLFDLLGMDLCASASVSSAGTVRPVKYQTVGKAQDGYLISEDGKGYGREVAPQLVTEADIVPAISYNNDLCCVIGRVESQLNMKQPAKQFMAYAREFVERLVRRPGVGVPLDAGEVYELQSGPRQRARANKEWEWLHNRVDMKIASFQKKETYGSANHPRNISTVPTAHTIRLSAYTYSFKKDVLKPQPWYVPGMVPHDIAERMAMYCVDYHEVSATDYSRFDGTISRWLRENVELAAYTRWVAPEYAEELRVMLRREWNAPATTSQGIRYAPGYSRLSGSPLTTDGNSMVNPFVSFAAMRMAGQTADAAMRGLGLYAGDDGVTGVSSDYMEAAAGELGLKLKCDPIREGEPVPFLGRVFINPWTTVASIQDPVRTARKLHISLSNPSVPREVALYWRATGYLDLDPASPVISNWCRLALRTLPDDLKVEKYRKACQMDLPYLVQSIGVGWPQVENWDLAVEVVARCFDVTPNQVLEWIATIDSASSLEDVSRLLPTEVPNKIGASMGSPFDITTNGPSRPSTASGSSPSSDPSLPDSGKGSSLPARERRKLRRALQHQKTRISPDRNSR